MPFYAFSDSLQNDQPIDNNRIFNLPHDFNEHLNKMHFVSKFRMRDVVNVSLKFGLMKRSFLSALINIGNKTSCDRIFI